MADFEMLRLSLSVPTVGPLLTGAGASEPEISREEFLRGMFASKREFFHGGRLFTYAPSPTNDDRGFILSGFIGKQVEQEFQSGPDNLFAVTRQKHWKASFVTIDVSSESQLLYFEKRPDVGSAQSIILSFVEHYIRDFKGFSWHIDVEYLTVEASFWAAVSEYRGEITEVVFEFVPPNVLQGYDKVKELDKLITAASNSDSSAYVLKNKDGALDPKGEFVEGAVKYSSEGAGAIKIKNGRKVLFNSKKNRRSELVPEELMPREGQPAKILGLIARLFGRRK